jgi:hypothetical protein
MRVLVIAGLLCAATAGGGGAWGRPASARPASARLSAAPFHACHSTVHHGVVPPWARTGFSSPRPRLPHVLGRSGEIVALIFGYPLHAPPLKDRGNKIVWVSRRAVKRGSDLRIHAQLMHGTRRVGRPVVRVVAGAGAVGHRPAVAGLLAPDPRVVGTHRPPRPSVPARERDAQVGVGAGSSVTVSSWAVTRAVRQCDVRWPRPSSAAGVAATVTTNISSQ